MSITVDTSELDDLARDLMAAGPRVQRTSAASVKKTAVELRDDAQAAAPVDTGLLRESIRIEDDGESSSVFSDLSYADDVEFGTYKDAPQPFLWPQARTAQESLTKAIERDSDPLT